MRTIRVPVLGVLAAFLLAASSASAQQTATTAGCVPECRSGYVCIEGACVSACNPPCTGDQTCTPEGQCVPNATTPATSAFPITVMTASSAAQPIVDDRAEVEAAVGGSVEDAHTNWLHSKTTRYPKFSDYMYDSYRGKKTTGVILAAAVGPGVFAIGGVISGVLFSRGSITMDACGDSSFCKDVAKRYYVGGAVIAGIMGAASITVVIIGSVAAKRNGDRLQKIGAIHTMALAEPRLEFVGFAPLTDEESKLSGLALQWKF
jgi:hypothetical protein